MSDWHTTHDRHKIVMAALRLGFFAGLVAGSMLTAIAGLLIWVAFQ